LTKITNDELEKFRPSFSKGANRDVVPLRFFLRIKYFRLNEYLLLDTKRFGTKSKPAYTSLRTGTKDASRNCGIPRKIGRRKEGNGEERHNVTSIFR